MEKRLNILSRMNSSPIWAIHPDAALAAIAHLIEPDASTWQAAKPSVQGRGSNKLGIIPIQGVLSKDGPAYYGSNYEAIGNAAENFANDPSVMYVVLAIDSPGGEVTGCPEAAASLAALAKVKPVSTMVDGQCASAALWLGSQANDIHITPSGEIGSVGVRMMHFDVSKMLDDMGVKVTELFSGQFKTEWSPYKPLSEEAQADMQPRLNAVHQDFINAVASGRGNRASAAIKASRFGGGRMFNAKEALGHGLVDQVIPISAFLRSVMQTRQSPGLALRRAALEVERNRV